jgi:hypothetical protein
VLATCQSTRPRVIEAEKLVLRDGRGKVVANFDATIPEPSLILYDAGGKVRARLYASIDHSGLTVYNATETPQVAIEGRERDASLGLIDGEGNTRAQFNVTQLGAYLAISGSAEKQAAFVSGERMELSDSSGRVIWRAP